LNSDDIIQIIIKGAIFLALMLLVNYLRKRTGHKNEAVSREFIENHFKDLRLLNYAKFSRSFRSAPGMLALLSDRIVFVSEDSQTRLEFPLAEVTGVKASRSSIMLGRIGSKLVIMLGSRKIRLKLQGTANLAWKLSLEKSAPMLAAGAVPKIGLTSS